MKDPHTFTFIGPKGRGKTLSVLGFIEKNIYKVWLYHYLLPCTFLEQNLQLHVLGLEWWQHLASWV